MDIAALHCIGSRSEYSAVAGQQPLWFCPYLRNDLSYCHCVFIVLSFIYGIEHLPSQKALLLLSLVEHGTFLTMQMQCCTRKPFWVAKPEPQSCSASAFPHFEADAEIGVYDLSKWSKKGRKAPKWAKVTRMIKELRLTFIHPADIGRASHLYFAALNIWWGSPGSA